MGDRAAPPAPPGPEGTPSPRRVPFGRPSVQEGIVASRVSQFQTQSPASTASTPTTPPRPNRRRLGSAATTTALRRSASPPTPTSPRLRVPHSPVSPYVRNPGGVLGSPSDRGSPPPGFPRRCRRDHGASSSTHSSGERDGGPAARSGAHDAVRARRVQRAYRSEDMSRPGTPRPAPESPARSPPSWLDAIRANAFARKQAPAAAPQQPPQQTVVPTRLGPFPAMDAARAGGSGLSPSASPEQPTPPPPPPPPPSALQHDRPLCRDGSPAFTGPDPSPRGTHDSPTTPRTPLRHRASRNLLATANLSAARGSSPTGPQPAPSAPRASAKAAPAASRVTPAAATPALACHAATVPVRRGWLFWGSGSGRGRASIRPGRSAVVSARELHEQLSAMAATREDADAGGLPLVRAGAGAAATPAAKGLAPRGSTVDVDLGGERTPRRGLRVRVSQARLVGASVAASGAASVKSAEGPEGGEEGELGVVVEVDEDGDRVVRLEVGPRRDGGVGVRKG